MKKVRRLSALLLAMIMVICSFAGCGSNNNKNADSDKATTDPAAGNDTSKNEESDSADEGTTTTDPIDVKLKIWGPAEEQKQTDDYPDAGGLQGYMCEQFNAAHPEWNITFEYASMTEGTAATEILKDASTAGDVFMFASDQVGRLVDSGVLYPIADQVGGADAKAANTPEAIAAASVLKDDVSTLYGFPFTTNYFFMIYDKRLFTEDDVKSTEAMMAKDLGDGAYNLCIDADDAWYIASYFLTAGCKIFGEDGTDPTVCEFNNDSAVKVGEYYYDLISPDNKKFLIGDAKNYTSMFEEGKLGAVYTGTWDVTAIKKALGDNYGAAKLPTINYDGTDEQMKVFNSYKLIGVNSQVKAEYAPCALALANYLAGEECQKLRFDVQSTAPASTTLAAQCDDETIKALNEQAQFTVTQPSIKQMNNYWTAAAAFGQGIINSEFKKEDVKSRLDEMVSQILSDLK